MAAHSWILLLYELPKKTSSHRVSLWRKLKKFGAVSLKTSAYLLPDTTLHLERFQWLAQQIRDGGGDANLIRVAEIEGMTAREVIGLFNQSRSDEYAELVSPLKALLAQRSGAASRGSEHALEKLAERFEAIRQNDFFHCPKAEEIRLLFERIRKLRQGETTSKAVLSSKRYQAKTWLTRPRPEIDRVGSAWLIKRFIDLKAKFVFAEDKATSPDALSYDMLDAEFTHRGEDCTFETLVKSFGVQNRGVAALAEMIHDADLEDEKFGQPDGAGIQRVLRGWG